MTLQGVRVAVVIPAFRAAATIARVVSQIPAFVDSIVVVDDASADQTKDVVTALGDPRVSLIVHPENRGVGGAMKTGYRTAFAAGADVIVKMDSDDQMDPSRIEDLVLPLLSGDAGYAKGNRLWSRSSARAMPGTRLFGNLFLSLATKAASGYWHIVDPTNGFTALRRDMWAQLDWNSVADRYYFETSLLVELHLRRVPVRDVLMEARYQGERSSLSVVGAAIEFAPRLAHSLTRRLLNEYLIFDLKPASFLGAAGAAGVAFGVTFGLYHWWTGEIVGASSLPGTVMVAALPVIVGAQCLIQALSLDIAESRTFEKLPPLRVSTTASTPA